MRVWLYALKKGLRQFVALEVTLIIVAAVVLLIFNCFSAPPNSLWTELFRIQLAVLFVFPVFVLAERYGVWRNNQVKPE